MSEVKARLPVNIDRLTREQFNCLPLVIEGESKEVRYAGLDADDRPLAVIRFKPTIYSFTQNRCAEVPGSDVPRLRASGKFVEVLAEAGIPHAYRQVNDRWVLADLVMPHPVEFAKYGLPPFEHPDLTEEVRRRMLTAPPIEIIAKNCLTGTTKHGCIGLAGSRVRASHPFYGSRLLEPDMALPEMLVRFDWRNPLRQEGHGKRMADQILQTSVGDYLIGGLQSFSIRKRITEYGDRVADTVLPDQIADLFIDVAVARRTAFLAAKAIEEFLATKDIVFYDICMFITEDGSTLYGEISPDCGRYRHLDLGELDKDVWRSGGSSKDVIDKWMLLSKLLGVVDESADQPVPDVADTEAATEMEGEAE
jgi:hypothetical protein